VVYSGNPVLLQGCPGGCWFDRIVLRDCEYDRGTGCAECGAVNRTSGTVQGAPGNRRSYCETGKIRRFLLRCPEPWVVDFPGRSLLILSARSIIIAEFLYSPIGIHRSVSRYVFLMAGEGRINVLSLSG
jgi:hypothetical protein